ncbi:cation:proton antiporter [Pseudogulbenkiania ferrooxidans]|uniref:Sodium/hydrogen exchanger n=1 Tax=Pseudogulbenkiania ferrooxidans 2002 TaxID=279714 RepID=B9Z568_9NEIS|nr:cation:proton antiporter [Pseudogulbenkiania ferrooxidans]EEG08300.1 sodium/hydrogen exchanger [Pseudogulbenkiania ferrooxidans 2002]
MALGAAQSFLPSWPLPVGGVFWIAVTLVLTGLAGEWCYRRLGFPRIVAYSATGMAIRLAGVEPMLRVDDSGLRVVLDLALALLLFELGARVDVRWLRRNPWLLASSVAEAGLSFVVVGSLLSWWGVSPPVALSVAAIAMAASPAIVSRVVSEFQSVGQVTERLLLMTTLNSIYAILLVKLLTGWMHSAAGNPLLAISVPLYVLTGSLLVALLLAGGVERLSRSMDVQSEAATVLLFGLILLATALLQMLNLSTLLAPLLAGVVFRSRRLRPWVCPDHFSAAGSLLVVVLFVVSGMMLSPGQLLSGAVMAVVLLSGRFVAKLVGVLAFARLSGLSLRQGVTLSLALTPLSIVAFVLATDLGLSFPTLRQELNSVLLGAVVLMELAGPLLVKWALERSAEIKS